MDHVGDMLNYLQEGLEKLGYDGVLDLCGVDRYRCDWPGRGDNWEIDRDSDPPRARALMWGKDGQFLITIEDVGVKGYLPDADEASA